MCVCVCVCVCVSPTESRKDVKAVLLKPSQKRIRFAFGSPSRSPLDFLSFTNGYFYKIIIVGGK